MDAIRRYLAEIGRRGGRKSRRRLDPATAREMVRLREARRTLRRMGSHFPGAELIENGVAGLSQGLVTEESLLVSIGAPRLRRLGWRIPTAIAGAEEQLYRLLAARHGDGAHGRYNALVRRLVSYERAAECAS